MKPFIERGARFLQHPRRVDQCGADAEVRRDVAEQVGQVIGGVLERLGDLAYLAQRERVTSLDQHPAGLRELNRPLDVEQAEADPVRQAERPRIEGAGTGEGQSGVSTVTQPAQQRVLLPGRGRTPRREDREPVGAALGELGLTRSHRHRFPRRIRRPGHPSKAAVLGVGEQRPQLQPLVHAASRSSSP